MCDELFSPPVLSAVMYRPINWKPRLFATRWTPCGTRRSPTVESQRKTCIAKHSGKSPLQRLSFLLFLSPSLPASLLSPIRKLTLAYKGFLIIHLKSQSLLLSVYKPLSFIYFGVFGLCWSFDPPPSPHLRSSPSSHLSCPLGSEKTSSPLRSFQNQASPFVFLPLCLAAFLSVQVAVTDWGQTEHRGAF